MIRESTNSIAVAVRVAVASSASLANVGTAMTSLLAVPLLHITILTAIATTLGSPSIVLTAYAGVLMSLGSTVVMGIVGQVARDRMGDVLTEILLNRPLAFTYWLGKAVPPVVTGSFVALLAGLCVYAIDPARATQPLSAVLAFIPVIAMCGMVVGVGLSLVSLMRADPYFFANGLGAMLPLTSGVVIPLTLYPPVAELFARAFPFANGIDAFRTLAAGGSPAGLMLIELLVSSVWFGAGVALAATVQRRLRDGASVELSW